MKFSPVHTTNKAANCAVKAAPPQTVGNDVDLDGLRCLLPACSREDKESYMRCLRRAPTSDWGKSTLRRMLDACIAAVVVVITAVPMLSSHARFGSRRRGRRSFASIVSG